MNTKDKTRKLMTEARQHEEHIDKNILLRSQEEIDKSSPQEIESEGRELMAKQRQHEENIKKTMLSRSEAQIDRSANSN